MLKFCRDDGFQYALSKIKVLVCDYFLKDNKIKKKQLQLMKTVHNYEYKYCKTKSIKHKDIINCVFQSVI